MSTSGKPPPSKAAANDAVASPPRKKTKTPKKRSTKAAANKKTTENGPLLKMFEQQLTVEEEKVDYVNSLAPRHEPEGIMWMKKLTESLKEEINEAIKETDYNTARRLKAELNAYWNAIGIEEKLLSYCNRLSKNVDFRISEATKNIDIDEIERWTKVKANCEVYLALVPQDDLEHIAGPKVSAPVTSADSTNASAAATDGNGNVNSDAVDTGTDAADDSTSAADATTTCSAAEADGADSGTKEHAASRKRKGNAYKYQSKSTVDVSPKREINKPTPQQYDKFRGKTAYKKMGTTVNPSAAPYRLSNGVLFCCKEKGGCGKEVDWNNRSAHLASHAHVANAKAHVERKKDAEEGRRLVQERIEKERLVGATYTAEEIDRQLTYTRMFFAGNMTFNDAAAIRLHMEELTGKPMPNRAGLADRVPDVHKLHLNKIKSAYQASFPEFGLVLDGSPFFAEAECIIVRLVHKSTWDIIELIVHLGLFEGSLDSDDIVKHIHTTIETRLGADPKKWRAAMMDRASTNKAAMEKAKVDMNANPLTAFCFSHGLSGIAKKFEYPHGRNILKQLTKMAKYKLCKARSVFKKAFDEAAKITRGVRWWVAHEHAAQTIKIGLPRIVTEYAAVCAENKWSEESAKGLLELVKDEQDMAKGIVELAAVVDVGGPFVSTTYLGESKAPMILEAAKMMRDLDSKYSRGVHGFDNFIELEKAAEEAAAIMDGALKPFEEKLAEAQSVVDAMEAAEAKAKADVERIETELYQNQAPTAQRQRRTSRQEPGRYATMANPYGRSATADEPTPLQEARAALEKATADIEKAKKDAEPIQAEIAAYKAGKLFTKDDFVAHGKEVAVPAVQDYIRLFIKEPGSRGQGDYYNIKKCYFAAEAFNPMEARTMSHAAIEACIEDLKHFGFDEFREINGILDDAVDEIPAYMACLKNTSDELLSSLPGAAEYDAKLQKEAAKDPSKIGKTWKDDHIESARRAWEWWRIHRDKFTYLSIAARLIVLVQISSASVERVFSQVKLIIDAIGVTALKDNIECRLFERVNVYPQVP